MIPVIVLVWLGQLRVVGCSSVGMGIKLGLLKLVWISHSFVSGVYIIILSINHGLTCHESHYTFVYPRVLALFVILSFICYPLKHTIILHYWSLLHLQTTSNQSRAFY